MTEIEIDRRQRVVAALMLVAIDLPQPMGEFAILMLEASKVCPGIKADELPNMDSRGRRRCLARARDLIDEMLAEMPAAGAAK